jgi:predicted  nucleic acid-binding Zn-ribbon protein
MKIEPSIKTEPSSDEDPISAAAAVLLRAVDQTKRAASESQAACETLEAKIKALEDAMKLQQADLDASRALSARRDVDLADRDRGMVESQKKLESALALSTRLETKLVDKDGIIADLRTQLLNVQSAVTMERTALVKGREDLLSSRAKLAKETDALRKERALFIQDQANLLAEKRAALENLKHTVGTLQANVQSHERLITAPAAAPVAPLGALHYIDCTVIFHPFTLRRLPFQTFHR